MSEPCPNGHNDWATHAAGNGTTRRRCRRCWADYQTSRRRTSPEEPLFYTAMRRARQRRIAFTLTLADVVALLEAGWVCCYCDRPLGTYVSKSRPDSASLDRIVPEDGYTAANTVLCCHECNGQKGNHTLASLRLWIDRITRLTTGSTPQRDTA